MGTPLREVIETIGGGPLPGRSINARAHRACRTRSSRPTRSTRPLSYEGLAAVGSGLGSAGFIVLRRPRRPGRGRRPACRASWPSSRAGSARRASRAAWPCPACSTSSAARRPTSATWPRSTSGSTRWPTAPGASSPPNRRSWRPACSTHFAELVDDHLRRRVDGRRTHAGRRAGRHRRRHRRPRRAAPHQAARLVLRRTRTPARPRPTASASTARPTRSGVSWPRLGSASSELPRTGLADPGVIGTLLRLTAPAGNSDEPLALRGTKASGGWPVMLRGVSVRRAGEAGATRLAIVGAGLQWFRNNTWLLRPPLPAS